MIRPTVFFNLLVGVLMLGPGLSWADTVVRGPYLQLANPTSMTIVWRVNDSDAQYDRIHYGEDPNSLTSVNSATNISLSWCSSTCSGLTEYEVTLTGLTPNTRYYYAIGNGSTVLNEGSAQGSFVTAPADGEVSPIRLWVVGDPGNPWLDDNGERDENNDPIPTGIPNIQRVKDAFEAYTQNREANLMLSTGDNAYANALGVEGTDGAYQGAIFNTFPEILRNGVFYSAMDDHGPSTHKNIFRFPTNGVVNTSHEEDYFSVNYGNIHIVSLDFQRVNNPDMLAWLQDDLANHYDPVAQPWLIAMIHRGPYSPNKSSDVSATPTDVRTIYVPVLEAAGLDLMLYGNLHTYGRSKFMHGHYGISSTFNDDLVSEGGMVVTIGDGVTEEKSGDGVYQKTPHGDGAVYALLGNSSRKPDGNSLSHPAMLNNPAVNGSMVLDVYGNRLEAIFLIDTGVIEDEFTIVHAPNNLWPSIFSATVDPQDAMKLEVQFSEPVELASAQDSDNYSIDNDVTVLSAVQQTDPRRVQLQLNAQLDLNATSYTLTVIGVEGAETNVAIPSPGIDYLINTNDVTSSPSINPPGTPVTEELSGETVTEDAYLRESSPNMNYGDEAQLISDAISPDPDNGLFGEVMSVMKWDVSTIPTNAIVQSASITLKVFNTSGGDHDLLEANGSWSESTVTWDTFNSAGGTGSTILGTIDPGQSGSNVITLNSSGLLVVQDWVNGSANHGIVVKNHNGNNDSVQFDSSEAAIAEDCPKLTITYIVPNSSQQTVNISGENETDDADLHQLNPNANFGGASSLEPDGYTSGLGEVRSVLRWDLSGIPTGSVVTGASVTITLTNDSPGAYHLFQAKTSWDEGLVNWNTFVSSSSIGTEVLGVIPENSLGEITIPLTAQGQQVVQEWIDAGENDGIIVKTAGTTNGIDFHSSEATGGQPALTVTYVPPSSGTVAISGVDDTDDAYLSEPQPSNNFGTAVLLTADGEDTANGVTGEFMSVVSWDVSGIPEGAIVDSASVTFTLTNTSSGPYHLLEAKTSWTESGVSWSDFSQASTIGTDVLGIISPGVFGDNTISLTAEGLQLVQGWIDGSITNNGLLVKTAGSLNGIDFHSSEATTGQPILTLTYSMP